MRAAYEHEGRGLGAMASWAIVVGLALVLVAAGLLTRAFVRDVPRAWDLGAFPDVPGQSPYAIQVLPDGVPRQMAPLPEAHPPAAPEGGG
jgi:hypothetical protein